MNVIYSWDFPKLEIYYNYQNLQNVVYMIQWIYTASYVDANNKTWQESIRGVEDISYDPSEPFIPFENLTKDIVTSWMESELGDQGLQVLQNNLQQIISNAVNPPSVIVDVPWITTSTTTTTTTTTTTIVYSDTTTTTTTTI
jgi:hypothetical protein